MQWFPKYIIEVLGTELFSDPSFFIKEKQNAKKTNIIRLGNKKNPQK